MVAIFFSYYIKAIIETPFGMLSLQKQSNILWDAVLVLFLYMLFTFLGQKFKRVCQVLNN